MSKVMGAALLVVAVLLFGWGANSSESFGSEVSRIFRGTPTDRTIWLLLGGAVTGVVGVVLLAGSSRKDS